DLAVFDELSVHADGANAVVVAKPVDPSEHEKWVSHREHSAAKCCADQAPGKNIGLMCHDRARSILRNVCGFVAGSEIGWPVPHKPFQELWGDTPWCVGREPELRKLEICTPGIRLALL